MSDLDQVDLTAVLKALPVPTARYGGLAFSVASAPTLAPARLGKSIEGEPAVLFPSSALASDRPPVELRHVTVLFGARCHVSGETEEESYFTVVRCHGDAALQSYFLSMARGLVAALGNEASDADVEKAVQAFVELFRAAAKPPMHALRGLWGELLLISSCANPTSAVRAWHIVADERFDFAAGLQRVEVKTTGRSSRAHHFSLEQLTAADLDVCVASIQVEPSAAGRTLLDLVDKLSSRLDSADDILRLRVTVGSVLGTDWTEYSIARFDETLSAASVRFYRADTVPQVGLPVPEAVTQVQFVSDLGACTPITTDELAIAGGLWAAIKPRKRDRV